MKPSNSSSLHSGAHQWGIEHSRTSPRTMPIIPPWYSTKESQSLASPQRDQIPRRFSAWVWLRPCSSEEESHLVTVITSTPRGSRTWCRKNQSREQLMGRESSCPETARGYLALKVSVSRRQQMDFSLTQVLNTAVLHQTQHILMHQSLWAGPSRTWLPMECNRDPPGTLLSQL